MTVVIFIAVLTATHFLARELMQRERVDFLDHHSELFRYALANSGKSATETAQDLNALSEKASAPFRYDLIKDGTSLVTGQTIETRPQSPRGPRPERRIEIPGLEGVKGVIRLGPPPRGVGPLYMTGAIFLAILLASFLSVFFLLRRFREKAEMAQSVLERMQQGDLKARFPISRWDDASHILKLFNEMADEIERLVEKLRTDEKQRLHLLQDIAHDLRTPISSLRTSIEGLQLDEKMDIKNRRELTGMAFQETEYLTSLVEDLLFLALVIEPKYKADATEISARELIQSLLPQATSARPEILVSLVPGKSDLGRITGSPHLITRLIRNALANALTHAMSRVQVSIEVKGSEVEIQIHDDGPGFSPEALASFGKKRPTRYLSQPDSSRISVGLGSVIMNAIAAAHGGRVTPSNQSGGVLTIVLPVSN
jgi:signal transduction histidine kinase